MSRPRTGDYGCPACGTPLPEPETISQQMADMLKHVQTCIPSVRILKSLNADDDPREIVRQLYAALDRS